MSSARVWSWVAMQRGGLEELRLWRARGPRLSAPGDQLVRVRATTINPIDIAIIGGYGEGLLNVMRGCSGVPSWPLGVGRDLLGDLHGERVWGAIPPHRPGALAQEVVVRDCWVGRAPSVLSAAESAALPFSGLTAAAALRAAGLGAERGGAAGARVLLLGLGGVGALALQLLRAGGARTVAVGSGPASGAEEVLDRRSPALLRQIHERGPYDAALDCAGLGGEFARRLRSARLYVTLSSPLLAECDRRGAGAGLAASAARLAAQTARSRWRGGPAVRWAYFSPCPRTLELLRRLADGGQLRARVRVFDWRDPEWVRAAAAGCGGEAGRLVLELGSPAPNGGPGETV